MSKLKKGNGAYSLLRPIGDKRGAHVYEKHEHLVAWYQFDTDISTVGDLPDKSGNGFTLSVSGSTRPSAPTNINSMARVSSDQFPSGWPSKQVTFNSNGGLFTLFDGDLGDIPSTTQKLSFGDGTNDSPFSIHVWINPTTQGTDFLVGKFGDPGKNGDGTDDGEYQLMTLTGGRVRFFLRDESLEIRNVTATTENGSIANDGGWYHIVATYDGRGGLQASDGMKIYINGKEAVTTKTYSSGYVAMENTSEPFAIGNHENHAGIGGPDRDFEGKIAEVAVWNTRLTSADVKVLYNARQGVSSYTSGIVSNPVRVLIREHDQVQGRYPVTTRTSPAVKKPSYKPFNDQNTFNFTSPFASAEIQFFDVPLSGQFIDLTGSHPSVGGVPVRKRFVFWTNQAHSSSYVEFKQIKEPSYPFDKITPILLNTPDRTTSTTQQAALLLMREINSSSLDIRATYEPEVVEKLENNPLDADSLGSFVRPEPVLRVKLRLEYMSSSVNYSDSITAIHGPRHASEGRSVGSIISDSRQTRIELSDFTINEPPGKKTRYPSLIGTSRVRTGSSRKPGLDGTATPHISPDIETKAKQRPGITDAHYIPDFGDHHTPFDDARISLGDSPFFKEGTPETTLPGFSSPLGSKTQIVLTLSSSDALKNRIFFNSSIDPSQAGGLLGKADGHVRTDHGPSGTFHQGISGVSGSGMAYWSPVNSEWQMLFRKSYPFIEGKTDVGINAEIPGFDGRRISGFPHAMSAFSEITQSSYSPFDWWANSIPGAPGFPLFSKRNACLGFALQGSGSGTGQATRLDTIAVHTKQDFFSVNNAEHNLTKARALDGYASPVIQWYFPLGDQYNATSSQVYRMSDHISSPFLLEKMHVEIDGVLGTHRGVGPTSLPLTKVLFILNQTTNPNSPHLNYPLPGHDSLFLTKSERKHATAAELRANDGSHFTWVNWSASGSTAYEPRAHGRREIVSYAKIGLIRDDNNIFSENFNFSETTTSEKFAMRAESERIVREDVYEHLLIYSGGDHQHAEDAKKYGVTASFGFNLFPKLPLRHDGVSFMHVKTSSTDNVGTPLITTNPFGGAALDGKSSGRHLAEGILSVEPHPTTGSAILCPAFGTSSFIEDPSGARYGEVRRYWDALKGVTEPGGDFRIKAKKAHHVNSPYLLLPTDNLIIGWQNHTAIGTFTGSMATEENVDYLKNVKITMYGSLISDDKETHHTLDQVLTTNEIHEAIYGEPVVDQFDVEPMLMLSGSTRDAIIGGQMKVFKHSSSKAEILMVFNKNPFPYGNKLGITDTGGTTVFYSFHISPPGGTENGSEANPFQVQIGGNVPTTVENLRSEIATRQGGSDEIQVFIPRGRGDRLVIRQKEAGRAGNRNIIYKTALPDPDGIPIPNSPNRRVYFRATGPGGKPTRTMQGGTGTTNANSQQIRGVLGSISAGHAGPTGSLTRNVTYTSDALLEDSLVAPIAHVLRLFYPGTGQTQSGSDSGGAFSATGTPSATNVSKQSGLNAKVTLNPDLYGAVVGSNLNNVKTPSLVISSNPASSSFKMVTQLGLFNNKKILQAKTITVASNYLVMDGAGPVTEAERLVVDMARPTAADPTPTPSYVVFSGTFPYAHGIAAQGPLASVSSLPRQEAVPSLVQNKEIKEAISSIVYSAPIVSNGKRTAPFRFSKGPAGPAAYPSIKMLKYGLTAPKPTSPKAYFRRNSYGQFRDLIEQAPETFTRRLIVEASSAPGQEYGPPQEAVGWPNNGGPVKSRFFTRAGEEDVDPIVTNCQNLSPFQTSSMPYIDGTNQDRDVVTHPPPDLTDKTSISEAVSVTIDPPE